MRKYFLFFICFPIWSVYGQFTLDYIYVNANSGQSSGGHSAIRINKLVYHFQYFPDKIFHIVREPWEEFRFIYGIQENRTIRIRKINLSKESYNLIFDKLNEVYLIQKKELENLTKIDNDLKILDSFLNGDKKFFLKGTGYFSKTQIDSKSYSSLKRKINDVLGQNYILKNLTLTRKELLNFEIKNIDSFKIEKNKGYPIGVNNYSKNYLELYNLLKAYQILYEELSLSPDSFFPIDLDKRYTINDKEKFQLGLYLSHLEGEIVQLLKSNSSNKGYLLLVSISRYLVIKKSILDSKLYFLDSFGKNHSLVVGEAINDKTFLSNINRQIQEKIEHFYVKLFETESISEINYTKLEDAVNRQREIVDGLRNSKPIRINFELMIPSKESLVTIYFKQEKGILNFEYLPKIQENKLKYEKYLQEKYSFNLFNRNCTTEIFHSINSFFKEKEIESVNRLGGVVRGDDPFVFVPFYAYYAVGKKYNIFEEEEVTSLRNKILNSKANKDLANQILESSTFTSKLYRFNKEDSFFIFFTDNIILARPILGFVNLIAGFGELGYGIIALPIDKGDHIVKGLQGIFFSCPEILFFNIRKGTFIFEGKVISEVDSNQINNEE